MPLLLPKKKKKAVRAMLTPIKPSRHDTPITCPSHTLPPPPPSDPPCVSQAPHLVARRVGMIPVGQEPKPGSKGCRIETPLPRPHRQRQSQGNACVSGVWSKRRRGLETRRRAPTTVASYIRLHLTTKHTRRSQAWSNKHITTTNTREGEGGAHRGRRERRAPCLCAEQTLARSRARTAPPGPLADHPQRDT